MKDSKNPISLQKCVCGETTHPESVKYVSQSCHTVERSLDDRVVVVVWYHISANSASLGACQRLDVWLDGLFENVLVGYHYFYKKMGGVIAKSKRGVVFKSITAKACNFFWPCMNREVCRFLACDILATHTVRKSRATEAEFRADVKRYYIKKHACEFKFESVYDSVKNKPKRLCDVG